MPLNPLLNRWIMKNRGEGSFIHLGKRTEGDPSVGEGSQLRDLKKSKTENPPAPRAPFLNPWILENRGEGSFVGANSERHLGKRPQGDLSVGEGSQLRDTEKSKMENPPAPRAPFLNQWIMKNRGEGSFIGANSERHLGERTQGDLSVGEGSQLRDPEKSKKGSPPAPRAYVGHYDILQPGQKWTSGDDMKTRGDLSVGEGSQLRDPKKTKMESPPASRAYIGHSNILQPGQNWTSGCDFPVEVIDGFKLGKDAKFNDGLTHGEISSRCLNGMGQVLSDFVRIVDGFGSGGADEVNNLWTALEQSEKEKAFLRDKVLSVHRVLRLKMDESERDKLKMDQLEEEKVVLEQHLNTVYKLYNAHRVARLRAEEESACLKAELDKLKAREDMRVQIKLETDKDGATNSSKKDFPA